MARKYHNYTLPTDALHCEEETQSTNSHMTFKAILSNHLSLPQCDDCKTRNDTKYCTTKQGPNTKKKLQTVEATTNNESTTTHTLP